MIRIGNAPVSYGAFEVTVGIDDNVPAAEQVLESVRSAGYEGIDLGPLGYFGLGDGLLESLSSHELLLAGGYVEIDVTTDEAARVGFGELSLICDQFDAVVRDVAVQFRPRPTVALLAPSGWQESEEEITRWSRTIEVINQVVDACEKRGYEAVLHNEVGTLLSSQRSIGRALGETTASLCLDTGHLVAAGGNPVALLAEWRDRVTHVHLKDARPSPSGEPYEEAMELWENNVFCKLGAGVGYIDEVLASLQAGNYSGWLLVEQDVLPRSAEAYRVAAADQVENRQYLRERGW